MNKEFVRVIKVRDLLRNILNYKKKIIILMVVGAIIGGGYAFASKKVYSDPSQAEQAELVAAKSTLNSTQRKNTEETADSYLKLENQRSEIQKYIDQSVYLNLNESTSASNVLVFNISGTKKAQSIISAIDAMLVDNSLCASINKALKTNYSNAVIYQLVRLNYNNDNDTNISVDVEKSSDNGKTFEIDIYAENQNQLSQISTLVKAKVNSIMSQIKKNYGSFTGQFVGSSLTSVSADQISNDKLNYVNKISTITSTMTSLMNNLGSNERTYFDVLVKQESKKSSNKKVFDAKALVKYIILFALLFAVLVIFYALYKYLTSRELRDANELERAFNLPLLSSVNDIDNLDLTKAELDYSLKRKDEHIAIVSSNKNEIVSKVEKVLAKDFTVLPAKPAHAEDFTKLSSINAIVLLEQVYSSDLDAINELIKYYSQRGIQVIGAIVINK